MNVTVSVCDIVVQIIMIMILVGRGCGGVVGSHVTRCNRLQAKL